MPSVAKPRPPVGGGAAAVRGKDQPPVAVDRGFRQRNADQPGALGHRSRIRRILNRSGRWFALSLVFLVTLLVVSPLLFTAPPRHEINQTAEADLRSGITFFQTDEAARRKELEALRTKAPNYYQYKRQALPAVRDFFSRLLQQADEIQKNAEIPPAAKTEQIIEWVRSQPGTAPLDPAYARRLLARARDPRFAAQIESLADALYLQHALLQPKDLERYRADYEAGLIAFSRALPTDIPATPASVLDLSRLGRYLAREDAQSEFRLPESETERLFLVHLLLLSARPNLEYDPTTTERERERSITALEQAPPRKIFPKGLVLVEKGRKITAEDLELLNQMARTQAAAQWNRLLAIALYVALLAGLVFYYIRAFRKDLSFTTANVFLVALPVLLSLLFGRLALEIAKSPDAAGYAFPAGLIGMLTVILLDARSGILLVTIGALAFAVATGLDFKIFLTSLLGGYSAVAALTTAKERKEVLRAGVVVGVVNALVILLINFLDDPTLLRTDLMFWGLANGLICAVIAMPALVLFESLFDVVTDIRLLELTGLDNPLLQELEEKAPGSYQHSLNVCKLSEAAAKTIGANYLLVRAGAYYHDIGKILKPKYFGENQVSLEEKTLHSKISPYMSAMIIKNHVKAGIDLARQHRLPEKVIDFIPQHQGTTIITFFYHQALKRFENSESTDPVREVDFRYPGPKPQSIEPAIVMLADTVEATVTSRFTSISVNEDELVLCVKKTVADKFNDGQFDDCDLTLRDLHLIRESFVKTLLGRFHQRIAYPTTPGMSGPSAPPPKRDRLEREQSEHAKPRSAAPHPVRV